MKVLVTFSLALLIIFASVFVVAAWYYINQKIEKTEWFMNADTRKMSIIIYSIILLMILTELITMSTIIYFII